MQASKKLARILETTEVGGRTKNSQEWFELENREIQEASTQTVKMMQTMKAK